MPVGNMDVNLTITTTPTSLYTLLAAINQNAPRNVALVEIQGTDGQTADVYVGGVLLADNNFSFVIAGAGDIFSDVSHGGGNAISLTAIFLKVVDAGADQTVHCRVRCT